MVKSLIAKGGVKLAATIKKHQEELVKLRKERAKQDRGSTYPSEISAREQELDDILLQAGKRPGTKNTISRGMSLEEAPLTKGEKTKITKLAEKLAKDNTSESEDKFMDYTEKLVEKYGSGIEDITDKAAKKAFNQNKQITKNAGGKIKSKGYKAGGKMKSKGYKAGGKMNKKPRGVGAATRGFGKAMR